MGQVGVKVGGLKEGGKDDREALSLWWKWQQLLITFFVIQSNSSSHTIRESTGRLGEIFTKKGREDLFNSTV